MLRYVSAVMSYYLLMPRGYILVLLCLTLTLGATAFRFAHASPTYTLPPLSGELNAVFFREAVQYWTEFIAKKGPESAAAEIVRMKNSPEQLGPKFLHTVAHAFGEALFRTGGPKNLYLCQYDTTWGCHHQFFPYIISVSTSIGDSVSSFFAYCDRRTDTLDPITCRHGIGHGLISYYGYTLPDLKKAFESCSEEDPNLEKSGCFSGALMEYNLRSLTKVNADHAIRPLTAENFFTPCDELDTRYLPICVRELTEWWKAAFVPSSNPEELFSWLGAKCRSLPANAPLLPCFEGIGYRVRSTGKQNVQELCALSTQNQAEQEACVRSATSPKDLPT